MRYEGNIYRPPSEAYSYILQVTIGCSHNKCTFCSMYKDKPFRLRKIEDILDDLSMAREVYSRVERIFLADGDALILPTDKLSLILKEIRLLFPECNRVGIYATPNDILRKSLEDLKLLNELGLSIAYMGIESGSDAILNDVNKGISSSQIIEAGKKIKQSGIKLSTTLISGLGGLERSSEHALKSAYVVSEIDPDYIGFLTLLIEKDTEIFRRIQEDSFSVLSPKEVMSEIKLFIENTNTSNCIFRSNHASNYVSLAGTLPQDKDRLISQINSALCGGTNFKNEIFRGF